MRTTALRSRIHALAGLACLMALVAIVSLLAPAPARADGDPASDVLATQTLFLPWDADVPLEQQAQLQALLQGAARGGYPIRMALIARASDLGSVAVLWQQPQAYAEFLAQELSLLYQGPLLVVMPGGFGVVHSGLSAAGVQVALADIRRPSNGAEFAGDAMLAVARLAAATGHRVSSTHVSAVVITGSTDILAWIVFAGGCALVLLAWAASLRALPPRRVPTTRA
jgi:hypothetical protein